MTTPRSPTGRGARPKPGRFAGSTPVEGTTGQIELFGPEEEPEQVPQKAPAAIACIAQPCDKPAAWGGLFEHHPNGMPPTHPVYYACDDHCTALKDAVKTWAVTPPHREAP